MTTFTGSSGNDTFTGSSSDDTFDLFQGGDDIAFRHRRERPVQPGRGIHRLRPLNGGSGSDTLLLAGDYKRRSNLFRHDTGRG